MAQRAPTRRRPRGGSFQREGSDGKVSVLGSGAIVDQLLEADLVDEFQLFVHPLVLGSGHTLFPRRDRDAVVRLELRDVGRTSTGVVTLGYVTQR